MKKYNQYVIILCLIWTFSCSKMEDTYKEYLEGGEIVYSVKVDSVFCFPGNERVTFKGFMKNPIQVTNIIIQWENQDKTVETHKSPYDYATMPDSFSAEISVPEGQYNFIFTTENARGNTSIPFQQGVKVYGPSYISYLANRTIYSMMPTSTGSVIITFGIAMSNMVITKFSYRTVAGETITKCLLPSENQLLLDDFNPSFPASYISGYLPEALSDTLYCETATLDFSSLSEMLITLDQTEFSIVSASSWEPQEGGGNGPAERILDGNTATYWQSPWSYVEPLPHVIVVDMNYAWNVFSFELWRRSGYVNTKTVVFEGSMDGSEWYEVGTMHFENDNAFLFGTLDVPDGKRCRYLRITITETYHEGGMICSLGELYVKGKI